MMTLEDQIRRYATDVAGPAVAEAPADLLEVGRPHHRGRWVLVAALVVFIAGLTWVATRPAELSDQPTVDTTPLPPIVSFAGDWTTCVDRPPPENGVITGPARIDGIRMEGALGGGICIGIGNGEPDIQWVAPPYDEGTLWITLDGQPLTAAAVNRCSHRGAGPDYGGTGADVDGQPVMIHVFDPHVATVVFTGAGGPVSASTFEAPGVHDFRITAIRGPVFPAALVPTEFYDADGHRIDDPPETGPAPAVDGCTTAGVSLPLPIE